MCVYVCEIIELKCEILPQTCQGSRFCLYCKLQCCVWLQSTELSKPALIPSCAPALLLPFDAAPSAPSGTTLGIWTSHVNIWSCLMCYTLQHIGQLFGCLKPLPPAGDRDLLSRPLFSLHAFGLAPGHLSMFFLRHWASWGDIMEAKQFLPMAGSTHYGCIQSPIGLLLNMICLNRSYTWVWSSFL